MGVPEVIAVPSKSYVAINSYKSDRSFPTTLCDLGRVSNIAAAVTLPRTSNFVNRNNVAQSVRSLPYKKRPISEAWDCTNLNYFHENVSTAAPETSAIVPHKKRRHSPESQSSTSALATQSTIKTNSDRNGISNPQVKRTKFNSTETSSIVSSENVSAANNINSFSYSQNTKRNMNTHLPFPHSTIQTLFLQPVQRRLQETTVHSHIQKTQHGKLHESNTNQLPNQHNVQLPYSEIGQLPTHHSLPMQLQQQNQLMRSQQTLQLPTPRTEELPTHHSLTMQLQQQNQQLRNENVQLQKQLSLFRQLIKNPQRLNQVIAKLEQPVH